MKSNTHFVFKSGCKLVYLKAGLLILLGIWACNRKQLAENGSAKIDEQLMVFAAASLYDVLEEIIDSFEYHSCIDVIIHTASSGTLARQIRQGEIPGVYISASVLWTNYLDSLGYLEEDSRTVIARNELALIAPKHSDLNTFTLDSTADLGSALAPKRLSIGDPQHVPAGRYAKQVLKYYGLYGQAESLLLPAKDVRSALMVVELGEAPLGIVYQTDAIRSEKVKILQIIPQTAYDPVVYEAALCQASISAETFLSFMQSEEMSKVWEKHGFHQW